MRPLSNVTPADIAVDLRRTVSPGSDEWEQLQSWIEQAERAIARRAERMGRDPLALDPGAVDDVVKWAVVRRATRPEDGAESTSDQIGIDVGSWNRTRRYSAGHGDIHILDTWWDELGLLRRRGAFTIRMGGRSGFRP